MYLSQLEFTWKAGEKTDFITYYAKNKCYPMPTKYRCILNPRFSSNYINHANKVAFPFVY